MAKHQGKVWIENNAANADGAFEVWFEAVSLGWAARKITEKATMKAAQKAADKFIERNKGWYDMTKGY